MNNQRHNEVLMHLVANKVKTLREAMGISQLAAYRKTGIHFGRIESGNSNVTVSTFSALCKFFDLSFDQFFNGIESNK